jgi:hypothetical protein
MSGRIEFQPADRNNMGELVDDLRSRSIWMSKLWILSHSGPPGSR